MSFATAIAALICLTAMGMVSSLDCVGDMIGKCWCGEVSYDYRRQYVVNCTNTNFQNTTALHHLPAQVEVLIFTGNNISELPWNVLGTLENYTNLRVVDMSNNNIREIKGKSYHHVANVQRLILNHNRIAIAEQFHHPRIFSNFVNLEELHLTNAFADNSDNLGVDLHDIFVSSNLTKLLKLHLEQNEVSTFQDRKVFCDLPRLMDLHLGDNRLTGIDFEIDCLKNLRYIDLEGNKIITLKENELQMLDRLPARGQALRVHLNYNPFLCTCGGHGSGMFTWIAQTSVVVADKDKLQCNRYKHQPIPSLCEKQIDTNTLSTNEQAHTSASSIALVLLISLVLFVATAILAYYNRDAIKEKITPMVNTVSRKVHYSTIRNNDDQEVQV